MTLVVEAPRTQVYGDELAQRILGDAAALEANPDFSGVMGVRDPLFLPGGTVGGHPFILVVDNQLSGTFKLRGASAGVMSARAQGYERVVTASTGSHGVSVAMAAARAGLSAVVYAPNTMTVVKQSRIEAAGAEVRKGGDFEAATTRAMEDGSGLFVHPFAMDEVRAGQATLGRKIVKYMASDEVRATGHDEAVTIVDAVAGGGKTVGIGSVVRHAKQQGVLGQHVAVVGVQPRGNNTAMRAVAKMQAGEDPVGLYAKGEQDGSVDALTIGENSLDFANLSLLADPTIVQEWRTVSNEQVGTALEFLDGILAKHGLQGVEAAGALPCAFAMAYARRYPYSRGNSSKRVTFVLPVSGLNGSPESNAPFLAAAHSRVQGSARAAGKLMTRQSRPVAPNRAARKLGY